MILSQRVISLNGELCCQQIASPKLETLTLTVVQKKVVQLSHEGTI
jgi:hypothetical protein